MTIAETIEENAADIQIKVKSVTDAIKDIATEVPMVATTAIGTAKIMKNTSNKNKESNSKKKAAEFQVTEY